MSSAAEPAYFESPQAFGAWLARHGRRATELVVGFHKVGTGRPSMTWAQAVDEALCHGWIDGVRKRVDDERYQIRFTPRKPTSIWSAINIERVRVLTETGRMTQAGLAAFALRREHKSRVYSFEQTGEVALTAEQQRAFRRHRAAWAYFEQQPPGYRKQMIWRILSAKQPATRERRLAALIDACARGERLR